MSEPRLNISTKYRFLFFHIPKTAGSSFASFGERLFDPPYYGHIQATEMREGMRQNVWNSYFKFTFVRNPWDRLVSLFGYFNVMGRGHRHYHSTNIATANKVQRYKSFKAMCLDMKNKGTFLVDTDVPADYHFISQLHWIADNELNILADKVIRFEDIHREWLFLRERLCLFKEPFPHVNASAHKPYKDYYDDETVKIVSDIYQDEIGVLDYEF